MIVVLCTLLTFALMSVAAYAETAPANATATITDDDARRHIEALASDEMMGRDTPSPELDSAARYIAEQFALAGISPVSGSYFHELILKNDDLDSGNLLSIGERRFALKEEYIPFGFTGTGTAKGSVVFAGYGISQPDSGYDDYANIDVRGKVVLVVSGEPRRFTPQGYTLRSSWFASYRQKMFAAARKGAAAILILPNPTASRLMRPSGYPWPALYPAVRPADVKPRMHLPDTADVIPALSVGGAVAKLFFGSGEPLIAILDQIDSTGIPASRELAGIAEVDTRIKRTLIPARNVMGVLHGRERPDEYVVLGAHYDHVGTRTPGPGSIASSIDTIFNGADDNASGTAALLMTARAFASLPYAQRPLRSIMFVAFTAEELGLYGSRAFVANPPVGTDQMVSMLNMDMVGRNNVDTLSVGGMNRSADLAAALDSANAIEPFTILDNIERDFYRSDQAPFARAGVPVLFFHSGEHADYHREGDNPDRIDNAKVAKVARLIFRTAWRLAEMPRRPIAVPVDAFDPKAAFIFER